MGNERLQELEQLFDQIDRKEADGEKRRTEAEKAGKERCDAFQNACEAHALPLLEEYRGYLKSKGCDALVGRRFEPDNLQVSLVASLPRGGRTLQNVCKFLITYSPDFRGSAEFQTFWQSPTGEEYSEHQGYVALSDLTAKHIVGILQPFIVARLKEVSAGAEG